MLALERDPGETVVLRVNGIEITIHIVECSKLRKTKLAFECPRHVEIVRGELLASWPPGERRTPAPPLGHV